MSLAGHNNQLGIKTESTYASAVTVDRFFRFVSEGVTCERKRITSRGNNGQRFARSDDWVVGTRTVSGSFTLELQNVGLGTLLEQCLGGSEVAGSGPYTHTFTPGDLPSMTVQIGRAQRGSGASVVPFTYNGVKVASWSLNAVPDQAVELTVNIIGNDETTATALATKSFADRQLMAFVSGSLTVDGTAVNVNAVTLNGDNGLGGNKTYMGSSVGAEPLEIAGRNYSGSIECDFGATPNLHEFYQDGTENTLVLTFSDGDASTLVITANVRYDGSTVATNGLDVTTHSLPFVCVASDEDPSAITVVYTTPDSAL